ncbi:DUF1285 domain-containing protein [Stappia indica]|uniref:DUF1285 domain-containing protein n=1 Tax=Stappia indica TaxID=538381 RepID=UPI001CD41B5E|nr:DUF1285 domain-containing protein [Stappia indica]MCA1299312.1 DUF1285 domain-containing protein [Stappia indica]
MPAGLAALIARAGKSRSAPPVERWNPPFCGDIDMRIAADGRWYYLGSPIGREALVRLFSSVLRREEDGRFLLVTPVEKLGITVEDAPFLGVELHADETEARQVLTLRTNVGDVVRIGAEHPLRFEQELGTDGLKPYVLVRGRLEALFSRPLLYQLVELFEERDVDGIRMLGVMSDGMFFPAMAVDAASGGEV